MKDLSQKNLNKNAFCVVNIKGGFGNQLFQYSFANYLKELGVKVKTSSKFYNNLTKDDSKITYREQIFDSTFFNFSEINKVEYNTLKFLKKIDESSKLKRVSNNWNLDSYSYIKERDLKDINKKAKYIVFDGYWQDIAFIKNQRKFLISKLSKKRILKETFEKQKDENSILLIVRRGDYLKMKEDLKIEYYEKCFDEIKKITTKPVINIFTDDEDWVSSQKIFNSAKKVYGPEESPENVIKLFSKMIDHKHFFVGNSTFSFFAAFLSEDTSSKVFISDPWFKNKESKNLFFENWIKLPNI